MWSVRNTFAAFLCRTSTVRPNVRRIASGGIYSESENAESGETVTKEEEEFDPTRYKNQVQVTVRTMFEPRAIYSRKDASVIGCKFYAKLLGQPGRQDIFFNVTSFSQPEPDITEFMMNNIEPNQTLKIEGIFRKSFSVFEDEFGEKRYRTFFSIGPKTIKISPYISDFEE